MKILIIGGSKSGKTSYAQDIASNLKKDGKLYYVATMKPYDDEDSIRIKNHIDDRKNYDFETLEVQKNIETIIDILNKKDVALIDSITALLCNEMFLKEGTRENCSSFIVEGLKRISNNLKHIVVVSDYLFSDSKIYDEYTNKFMKELALSYRELANEFDVVIECNYKNIYFHKGKEFAKEIL